MFKQATLFKVKLPQPMLAATLNEKLEAGQFLPCGATQQKSMGWVPPRGIDHGAMAEHIGGQLILAFKIQTKSVPASAIKQRVSDLAKKFEEHCGDKPGRKILKEFKEAAQLDLLPAAFPKTKVVQVWIDSAAGIMLIDSTSDSATDDVAVAFATAVEGAELSTIATECSPAAIMGAWLHDGEATHDFSIGRSCELKSTDETKAVVRYANHSLDTNEVRDHIATGKVARKLGLTWRDRVAFVLDDAGKLSKLEFLDVVMEDQREIHDAAFDANVAIATGELKALIPDLIEALGGEPATD